MLRDVIIGHHFFFNNFGLRQDKGAKTSSMCLPSHDKSTDMQHDMICNLFGSGYDLELRSNIHIFVSFNISLDVS